MICENKPLISIALCTYNGEKYIEKQLDSLVSQSYTPIEIVISDDSSTDGTWNILEKYAAVYPFIKLFKSRINLGFTKNFEQAISFCNGDFIALSDQDDIWDTDKLSILYNELGDSDLFYHDSNFIDENDNPILG
ncbi:MAG: glycosyltransferase, partial [Pedobacter sp.]